MTMSYKSWKRLFLFCLGLFAGTAICMKWLENDFIANGSRFTIIGLEITYPKEQVAAIFSGLEEPARSLLRFQLLFDFAFMAGVYPGIAALCIMAFYKSRKPLLRLLLPVLAVLQAVAWTCDIIENSYLLKWLNRPESIHDFGTYHFVVWVKWILALAAALIAIPVVLRRTRN